LFGKQELMPDNTLYDIIFKNGSMRMITLGEAKQIEREKNQIEQVKQEIRNNFKEKNYGISTE